MSKLVTILGVGALGSHLSLLLRNESITMRLVDFDRVESKNTQAQFHTTPQNGKLKVNSLADTLRYFFRKDFTPERVPTRLSELNTRELLGGSDLVVDCFDNGASRRIAQDYVRAHRIPCIHAGLSGDGTFGLVRWDETFKVDDEPSTGAPTCEDGRFLPFIMLTSSCLALAVQEFLHRDTRVGYTITPTQVYRC